MTHDPRTTEEIYTSLRDSLKGKIRKLTNFTDRSFNAVWTNAIAEELQKLEVVAAASELSAFIEYSGGDITQSELDALGYEELDAADVNKHLSDRQLDLLVELVGVERFEGAKATGKVTFTTQSGATDIPKGTVVTTVPDSDGSTLDFVTTQKADTSSGETSVTVPIEAQDVGTEYNVPAETILRMEDPPIGVTGVVNNASTTGGEDIETNDELRSRAKKAVEGASEGGTVSGIKAYIRENIDGVREGDVLLDEFYNRQPPFVDVIVDGGTDTKVADAISQSRPAGIRHNLVRPEIIQIDLDTVLRGTDIDTSSVTTTIEDWLLSLGIGDNFYEDELVRQIMTADDDIINIERLSANIGRVTNERFEFNQDIERAIADDGGTLTDETANANDDLADDMTLLPASPATGDAYYFGESTPFSGFELDISTAGSGTYSIVWEYYDGSSWQTLSNVTDNTNGFRNLGKSTVSWDVPSDWVRANVGEQNEYFVRARLDSFTSLNQQPLGQEANITGNSYRLDFTIEDNNGTVTVEDDDGDTYTQGADYYIRDTTGDGWPETILWEATATTPNDEQIFTVDYDVTTSSTSRDNEYRTDLVRDEILVFDEGVSDTFDFDTTQNTYQLDHVPFIGTTSISDDSGNTYTTNVDYELIDNTGNGFEQTIDWDVALDGAVADDGGTLTDETTAANNDTADDMTLLPASPATGDAYYFGHDYEYDDIRIDISTAGAGTWDILWEYYNGSSWTALSGVTDGTNDFRNSGVNEVSWTVPNDWAKTTVDGKDLYWVRARLDTFSSISTQPLGRRADQDETPDNDEPFTVTYDQRVYDLTYEVEETPAGEIDDKTGDTYQQDTDYQIVDYSADAENDAVEWLTNPSTLADGEEFYVTYLTEGDRFIAEREKVDPGTINFSVE